MSDLKAVRREQKRNRQQTGMKVNGMFVKTTLSKLPGTMGFAAKRRDEANSKKRKRK